MPNDGNSQTEEDVMPSNVGNSERWDAFNDENLQTQESMVIVFDSGGKWWALMNLTGLVDWLLRNFLSQFAKASDMLASWPDMLTLLIDNPALSCIQFQSSINSWWTKLSFVFQESS